MVITFFCKLGKLISMYMLFFLTLTRSSTIMGELRWKHLTSEEIDSWYSPFDLCLMNTTDRFTSPQQIRRKKCDKHSKYIKGKHGFCHVGMGSNKKECSPPYSGRESYKRGIVGYTDASKMPLVEAFKRFGNSNTDVLFLGDSTMTQKRMAMDCELRRETRKLSVIGSLNIVLPCHSTIIYQIPKLDKQICEKLIDCLTFPADYNLFYSSNSLFHSCSWRVAGTK